MCVKRIKDLILYLFFLQSKKKKQIGGFFLFAFDAKHHLFAKIDFDIVFHIVK